RVGPIRPADAVRLARQLSRAAAVDGHVEPPGLHHGELSAVRRADVFRAARPVTELHTDWTGGGSRRNQTLYLVGPGALLRARVDATEGHGARLPGVQRLGERYGHRLADPAGLRREVHDVQRLARRDGERARRVLLQEPRY